MYFNIKPPLRRFFLNFIICEDKIISRIVFKSLIDGKNLGEVEFSGSINIYKALISLGIVLPGISCGGNASCGKCLIYVKGDAFTISIEEKDLIFRYFSYKPNKIPEKYGEPRLACFCAVKGNSTVYFHPSDKNKNKTSEKVQNVSRTGIAIDIGTTTLELSVADMATEKVIYYSRELNTQKIYGTDVLSRINNSNSLGHLSLHKLIIEQIKHNISDAMATLNIDYSTIDEIVVTGNTTMLHFFYNLDPYGIGVSPFIPQSLFGITLNANSLFEFLPQPIKLFIAPCIGPYIGGDISCGILHTEIYNKVSINILVDIGTNGEIVLCKNGEIYCCSTAAGPAFEGGEISMGMVANDGAIYNVWLENERIEYSVISDIEPVGICGTGIISAIEAFLIAGIIDPTGKIVSSDHQHTERIIQINSQPAVLLTESGIFITQQDIRNIQLAKAAISAGISTLLYETSTDISEIEHLYLSGGFGSGINAKSAAFIGLIPKELSDRTVSIGNSSLQGAVKLLLNKQSKNLITSLAGKAKELTLSSNAVFMEKYIEMMTF